MSRLGRASLQSIPLAVRLVQDNLHNIQMLQLNYRNTAGPRSHETVWRHHHRS
jgi:hypothetical protein